MWSTAPSESLLKCSGSFQVPRLQQQTVPFSTRSWLPTANMSPTYVRGNELRQSFSKSAPAEQVSEPFHLSAWQTEIKNQSLRASEYTTSRVAEDRVSCLGRCLKHLRVCKYADTKASVQQCVTAWICTNASLCVRLIQAHVCVPACVWDFSDTWGLIGSSAGSLLFPFSDGVKDRWTLRRAGRTSQLSVSLSCSGAGGWARWPRSPAPLTLKKGRRWGAGRRFEEEASVQQVKWISLSFFSLESYQIIIILLSCSV